jgi:hypothetical protein
VFWTGGGHADAAAAVEAVRRDAGAFESLYRKYVALIDILAPDETRDSHAAKDLSELMSPGACRALPRWRPGRVIEGTR